MEYLVQNENDIENDINNPHTIRLMAALVIGLAVWFISLIIILRFIKPSINQTEQVGVPFVVYTIITVLVFITTLLKKIKGLWLAVIYLLSVIALICLYCGGASIVALF